jgi:hypothetical protein
MIAVVRILCQMTPSFTTSLVNGLLASATTMGGSMALLSGLPAAMSLFVPVKPEMRADAINRGLGLGFLIGAILGSLMLFVFIARLAS